MALDFPNAPSIGQIFPGPGGIQWMWDGIKWIVVGPGPAYATTTYVQTAVAPALNNIGRNKLHNGLFRIAQRTNTPWTASGYTLDRWTLAVGAAGDTASVTRNTLTDTARASIGDEEAQNALQIVFTGGAGAANQINIAQRIEDVMRLSGKTIIVSFLANSSVANMKVGVSANQNFGTGGSPSAIVSGVGQAVTLSATAATWTRQSVMLMLPSAAGKTLGTNNDHQTTVVLWLSSGANNAAGAGNIGGQSGTVNIWGVQVEIAQPGQTQPSPVEKLDPRQDLDNCQRYYVGGLAFVLSASSAAGNFGGWIPADLVWSTPMRASPTIVGTWVGGNVNPGLSSIPTPYSCTVYGTSAAGTAGSYANFTLTASADL
jgi:hypothetical protein